MMSRKNFKAIRNVCIWAVVALCSQSLEGSSRTKVYTKSQIFFYKKTSLNYFLSLLSVELDLNFGALQNTHLCPLAGSNAHTLFSFVDSSSSLRLKLRTRLLSTTCAYFDRSSALRRGQDLDQSETAWAALHDERARLLLSKIVPNKNQQFFTNFIIQLFKYPI